MEGTGLIVSVQNGRGELELKVNQFGITGNFFIEKDGKKVEKEVAFNRPLISREGFLWIKDVIELNGIPAVEVKFSEFSVAPVLFIVFFGASLYY